MTHMDWFITVIVVSHTSCHLSAVTHCAQKAASAWPCWVSPYEMPTAGHMDAMRCHTWDVTRSPQHVQPALNPLPPLPFPLPSPLGTASGIFGDTVTPTPIWAHAETNMCTGEHVVPPPSSSACCPGRSFAQRPPWRLRSHHLAPQIWKGRRTTGFRRGEITMIISKKTKYGSVFK